MIFIYFKNPQSSAGFEPSNLESNKKDDNHNTTEKNNSQFKSFYKLTLHILYNINCVVK
jgi:hypothetical protein